MESDHRGNGKIALDERRLFWSVNQLPVTNIIYEAFGLKSANISATTREVFGKLCKKTHDLLVFN